MMDALDFILGSSLLTFCSLEDIRHKKQSASCERRYPVKRQVTADMGRAAKLGGLQVRAALRKKRKPAADPALKTLSSR